MVDPAAPILIFDSGVGGLSVAAHVMRLLPGRSILYFGDSARVPYGSKSEETVRSYTRQACHMLGQRGIALIGIACNTASAVALETASSAVSVPVVGVIEPGALAAVSASKSGRIGVIGTRGTVRSGAYGTAIRRASSTARVYSQACPLLVGLAEEGLIDHQATRLIIEEYLDPLLKQNVDTLVLGCTHYPILRKAIASIAGPSIRLVDPGEATAGRIAEIRDEGKTVPESLPPRHHYILSDLPHRFIEVGESFLGEPITSIEKIPLEELTAGPQ